MAAISHSCRSQSTPSMMESLPSDVMVKVLEFVELPVRIQLASSSKTLQRLIFWHCKSLWVHIDLSNDTVQSRTRLTDTTLASLLVQVNARRITQTLLLSGVDNVQGYGLVPLCHSRVLENVDLDGGGFQNSIVVDILRTMVPFNLFHVRLGEGILPSREIISFLHHLRSTKLQQARDKQIKCSCCQDPVARESIQLVPYKKGVPSTRCEACRNHFCRRASCSAGVLDCQQCGDPSCDACGKTKRCEECNGSFCSSCNPVEVCGECSKAFCDDCDLLVSCDQCKKQICEDCNEQLELPMRYCERCEDRFCRDCKSVLWCDMCDSPACKDCAEVKGCDRCQQQFCVFCREVNYLKCCEEYVCDECEAPRNCNRCMAQFCRDAVSKCEACSEQFCSDCCEVSLCCTCGKDYCAECRQVNYFDCCQKSMCVDCIVPEQSCDSCEEITCTEHIAKCEGGCERSFCAGCSVATKCDSCQVTFCTDCRLINALTCCNKAVCIECFSPKQCFACRKPVCNHHVEVCGGCEQLFCNSCRDMKPCGRCSLCFCTDDCSFVDECEKCEMVFCEECAVVVRCACCGHTACEQCRRTAGGFCGMCNDQPRSATSKKRRRIY